MEGKHEIKFFFNIHDPEFYSKPIIVDTTPGKYISHVFIRCPIYDRRTNKKIGYKVSDDYLQQLGPDKYSVRISNTYYFKNGGTISWSYAFINNVPEVYYPVGKVAESNVINTTGYYLGKKGHVKLLPTADGLRKVNIKLYDTC